jgi:hypothetical protein
VLALEVALVLELGFPPNLDLGLAPGTDPSCARRSLGEGSQPDLPCLQLEASLCPCSLDLSVL